MKAMFMVLGIVALIATTNADIPVFTPEKLQLLGLTKQRTELFTATLINSNVQRPFKTPQDLESHSFSVVTKEKTSEQENGPKCGNSLGIEIDLNRNGVLVVCDLTVIRVSAYKQKNGEHMMMMNLLFAYKKGAKPLGLVVPIFRIPPTAPSAEQGGLDAWATANNVGVISPFDYQQLTTIQRKGSITVDFAWLQNLLTLKLSESSRKIVLSQSNKNIIADGYISRPLLLPDAIADKIMAMIA